MMIEIHRRGIRVIEAKIALISNNKELIYKSEYFSDKIQQSLLTDFHSIKDIELDSVIDSEVYIIDQFKGGPEIILSGDNVYAIGDFSRLEKEVLDRRYTLFGNTGFLYRYIIVCLEKYHDIYSFHASAIYDESNNELYIIVGGAGAGKTCYLLSAIEKGWKIFSTEMTHFRLEERGCVFFKGSLFDNVRVGNFIFDYPSSAKILGLKLPDVKDIWGTKIAVDMKGVQVEEDELKNPKIRIIYPKVEAGRDRAIITDISQRKRLIRILFENATEKSGTTVLLYETLPMPSLDSFDLMIKRVKTMEKFIDSMDIISAENILCGPKNCLEGK